MQQPKKKQKSNNNEEQRALRAMAAKSKAQGNLANEQQRSHLKDELRREEQLKNEAKAHLKDRYGKEWRNVVGNFAAFKDGSGG